MTARDPDAVRLSSLAHVRDQVLPAEREPLLRRGEGERDPPVEKRARLAEDPRMLDGVTPDHDAGAAGFPQRALRVLGRSHVAVHDHGNGEHLARPSRVGPVGRARVPHLCRPAMDGERGHAGILQPARQIDDGHLGLGPPADAGLHRERDGHRLHQELRHLHHRRGIAEPPCASAATGDLGHPAAAVHVDEGGARLLRDHRRLGQTLGVGAVDLDRRRLVPVLQRDLAAGALAPAEEPLDVHEFRDAEIGPVPAAQPAEHRIGHVLHRGEDDRRRTEGAVELVSGEGHGGGVKACRWGLAPARRRPGAAWKPLLPWPERAGSALPCARTCPSRRPEPGDREGGTAGSVPRGCTE
jgi:hypothetical protein